MSQFILFKFLPHKLNSTSDKLALDKDLGITWAFTVLFENFSDVLNAIKVSEILFTESLRTSKCVQRTRHLVIISITSFQYPSAGSQGDPFINTTTALLLRLSLILSKALVLMHSAGIMLMNSSLSIKSMIICEPPMNF